MSLAAVVIPAKSLLQAKSRLGLAAEERRSIMTSLLTRTIAVSTDCVADPPAPFHLAPDEIDVFTDPHGLVEPNA